ncbi:MAG: sarcosine oxidase subunit alpha family protein [Xanthomonadales bacterium]|nr:sarcosine oxidase subunit alpha family protein [Xanthomonadales bacterium]NIN58400.1 sarcosine oxidase subunit alpha family protein [Xanthomonadales bacterium]NIN73737.1 sarcosine oxidase subunit alpha family protein [Xanthomonadales bacterium]NIO14535.1 sarcosine oxidase subunit alpha family protein [Xanthomonadales bacterium]NIP10793.1 sarcosine oxidase subunit alpha family protein [Xanthomonadales bacterium]
MSQAFRLPVGGRIRRDEPLEFTFNGRTLSGFAGDTLASALLANGCRVVGRSFKYHRPRGIMAAGAEEPNAIVQVGRGQHAEPNLKATQVELQAGLEARSVRGWPSVNFDLGRINDRLGGVLAAGFYYKTFMSSAGSWHRSERFIRRAAGLGWAPTGSDPDRYESRNAHCDVLVVGAGPAGLSAARSAALAGARVLLVDDQPELGGALLACRDTIDRMPAKDWLAAQAAFLEAQPRVRVLRRCTAFGYHDHNFLSLVQHDLTDHAVVQRLWRVRAKQVVLAQGAFERSLVFPNNDLPGVMLASAVSTYIRRYAVRPGCQLVVFTNNDSGYQAAIDWLEAGGQVEAIVDCRDDVRGDLPRTAQSMGARILTGTVVAGARGRSGLRSVEVAPAAGSGVARQKLQCDVLAMSGGWNPAVHLHSQSGGRNQWQPEPACFTPGNPVQAAVSAGACNGVFGLRECLAQGHQAGQEAARRWGFEPAFDEASEAPAMQSGALMPLWRVPEMRGRLAASKQFIDYQNDTTLSDLRLALREGFEHIEHIKRYTALGFGTDQGKMGNINGMALVAEGLGKTIPEVGTTTFRPPFTPVRFGACAGGDVGDLYEPVRKTPLHEWQVENGAPFEVVGQWLRAHYYPHEGEDLETAVCRECLATRASVGIMDASTLGKIDVSGPDAETFLERLYTHDIARMSVGRCAYGVMLGEDGMVMDDGVMARLGPERFYVTTTTGGAANVLSWMELWLQTEWPDLQVRLTSLTETWSTIALAGPNSRQVLRAMGCDVDLEPEAFPFMTTRTARLENEPVRLFRISFSGELAYEINVRSDRADFMWRRAMAAGAAFGITPYGTETMHVLRAEKGFIIVGQDTDGSVTPVDLGMNWMMSKSKDYIGRRSLARPDCVRPGRKQWVGFRSLDDRTVVREGSQLVQGDTLEPPVPLLGHVSSSYFSACLGYPIALGLLNDGKRRHGEELLAVDAGGGRTRVRVVAPVFYDPEGERQHA